MKKAIYTLSLIMFSMNLIIAQDNTIEEVSEPTLEISGTVDAYSRTNFGADFDEAPGTSFANLPGFSLGMINLILSQEGEDFGFTADLVFGPRGEDATFLSSVLRPGGSSNIVNQLFAYWKVSDAVKFTLGNFNTFLGYEVISPADNFNYSTSYMFSYGPFSHTGLKADISLDGGFSLMVGIFNPTDATEYNPNNKFAYGLQVGYESGRLGIWMNGLYSGADNDLEIESFSQFDITAGYEVSEKIYVGLNATTASNSFTGFAGYFQIATTDDLKLGLRAESFTDNGLGLFEEDDNSVVDFTLSANYTVGNLTIIPELRLDAFSGDVISNDGVYTNSLSSFVLAAVYGF